MAAERLCSTCPLLAAAEIDDFKRIDSEPSTTPTSTLGRLGASGALRSLHNALSGVLLKIWPNGQENTRRLPVGAQGWILRHAGLSADPAQVCASARTCIGASAQMRQRRRA